MQRKTRSNESELEILRNSTEVEKKKFADATNQGRILLEHVDRELSRTTDQWSEEVGNFDSHLSIGTTSSIKVRGERSALGKFMDEIEKAMNGFLNITRNLTNCLLIIGFFLLIITFLTLLNGAYAFTGFSAIFSIIMIVLGFFLTIILLKNSLYGG